MPPAPPQSVVNSASIVMHDAFPIKQGYSTLCSWIAEGHVVQHNARHHGLRVRLSQIEDLLHLVQAGSLHLNGELQLLLTQVSLPQDQTKYQLTICLCT